MKQYDFPDLNAVGKGIVRYFSITNPWMDFVVIVEKDEKEYVRQIIYEAMDEYWASDFEAYGDVVERNLTEANISFQINSNRRSYHIISGLHISENNLRNDLLKLNIQRGIHYVLSEDYSYPSNCKRTSPEQ